MSRKKVRPLGPEDDAFESPGDAFIMGKGVGLLTLTVVALAATSAFAQGPGRHSVTGFVGGQLFDVGDQFSEAGSEFQTQVNFGGRYQYRITERWAVEGNFLFSPGNTELLSAGASDVDVDAYYYTGGVVFNVLTNSRIVPYLTGGAGAVTLDVGDGGNTDTKFVFTFGGGFRYDVGPGFGVSFDVRDFVYSTGQLGSDSLRALRLPKGFDETIHDVSFTVGLGFRF